MFVITGATSRTGSLIAAALLRAEVPVRVIGRSLNRLQPLIELGAQPYVADPTDARAMEGAFIGAEAAWVMLQPNYIADSPDFRAFQRSIIAAVVPALAEARVQHVVSLSSWGADKPSGTGPVAGLYDLEQALSAVENLDVLNLRAGYFMQNLLPFADEVANGRDIESPYRADVSMPMISVPDIAGAATEALLTADFHGKISREIYGPNSLSMAHATSIIGHATGKHGLSYRQISLEAAAKAWTDSGTSPNVTGLMLEVVEGINSGYITSFEKHNPATKTTFEQFIETEFMPLYREALAKTGRE
jgi:uncharacterized protein YbjT (DUF2867 family)